MFLVGELHKDFKRERGRKKRREKVKKRVIFLPVKEKNKSSSSHA